MKLYLIDEGQVRFLRLAAARLYSEVRMDGDLMRDLAQGLDAIVRRCEQVEVTGSAP